MSGYASNEYIKSKKWISQKIQEGFDWESVKHFCVTPDKEYETYQLFAISSEEEYRLMSEINKAFKNLEASTAADNTAVYRINDQHSVIVADGFFTITTDSGEVLDRIAVSDFSRSPRAGFRRIKNTVD